MTSLHIVFLCLLVALPFESYGQGGSSNHPAESAGKFAQQFYDWYVPLAVKETHTLPSEIALKQRPQSFSPELTRMLHADAVAEAKSPGMIVGIDWDPFLYGQDPATQYRVGKIVSRGTSYLVEVHSVRAGQVNPMVDVTAEVAGAEGHWHFVNFLYPENHDLLSSLRALADDRRNTHP